MVHKFEVYGWNVWCLQLTLKKKGWIHRQKDGEIDSNIIKQA